jgi:hypothetical protein
MQGLTELNFAMARLIMRFALPCSAPAALQASLAAKPYPGGISMSELEVSEVAAPAQAARRRPWVPPLLILETADHTEFFKKINNVEGSGTIGPSS